MQNEHEHTQSEQERAGMGTDEPAYADAGACMEVEARVDAGAHAHAGRDTDESTQDHAAAYAHTHAATQAHIAASSCEQTAVPCELPCMRLQNANLQALPDPGARAIGALPETSAHADEERIIMEVTQRLAEENRIRVHYYVKIAVSVFLCALLLAFGIPVFMASRMTGSLSYTALGVVLIAFGLVLAVSVLVLLFKPPQILRENTNTSHPSNTDPQQ